MVDCYQWWIVINVWLLSMVDCYQWLIVINGWMLSMVDCYQWLIVSNGLLLKTESQKTQIRLILKYRIVIFAG